MVTEIKKLKNSNANEVRLRKKAEKAAREAEGATRKGK